MLFIMTIHNIHIFGSARFSSYETALCHKLVSKTLFQSLRKMQLCLVIFLIDASDVSLAFHGV